MNIDPKLNGNKALAKRCMLLSSTAMVALVSTPGWAQEAASSGSTLQEIVVTATRQEQVLSKVPISITAIGQAQMDSQGLKQLDDMERFTPGLKLTRLDSTGANVVAIRGIRSNAGSGTTGIYIDDTPIQVRNLGFGAGTAFPGFFDLERVEVLRGPQGTLFGAGSEGGTIRFIQTTPSLTEYGTYARGEVSGTRNGDPSYEGGAAFGGPIIDDRLGFRMSAFYRREGGFVDGVTGNVTVTDPTGAAYGDSTTFERTGVDAEDINWNSTTAFRAALKFQATDALTITPSFSYQKQHVNDGTGQYSLATSDEGSRNYSRLVNHAGDPATNPLLNVMNVPDRQEGDDEFYLSALGASWDLGNDIALASNTSYFDRTSDQWFDFTQGYLQFYLLDQFPNGTYARPGQKAMSVYNNSQKNFVQEFRLQSTDRDARLSWVAGVFYSHNKQTADQQIHTNFLDKATSAGFEAWLPGSGLQAYANGNPYGPGSSALANFLGIDQLPNGIIYTANWETIDEQLAGFAQVDYRVTDALKLTVGLRASQNKLKYNANFGGPETNGNAPFGFPVCFDSEENPVGCNIPVGTGVLTPVFPVSSAATKESAVTPKIGLSYELDDSNMLYATAAKGFRPGGASLKVPSVCNPELDDFGYATQPQTYDSDSVWSYELGTKNKVFDGRVILDASVYLIKWKDIQASVFLPSCAYDFVDNLANATSQGFDLGFQALVFDGLTMSGTVGYNKSTFDSDAASPGGVVIYSKDSSIPQVGAPWTFSLSGQYDFTVLGTNNMYLRADVTHAAKEKPYGSTDSGANNYDPLERSVPAYSVVNARVGLEVAGADVSLFIDNLTDENPNLNLNHSDTFDLQDWSNSTLRARTYGLTVTYRY